MNILTIENLRDTLKISDKQARALMVHPDFPGFKIGSQYRVLEDDLKEWIQSKPCVKLDYSKA